MRYGIFSDIHGNKEGLEAALRALDKLRIDKYICLGDVVGYGADPSWCIQTVRQNCEVCIMGNHDAAICGKMDYSFYYDAARQVLEWTKSQLSSEEIDWLKNLPYKVCQDDGNQCFTHGDPFTPENYNYIYNIEHARALVPKFDELSKITWVGHSHLMRAFQFERGKVQYMDIENFVLAADYKYLIAEGSVGQPRDGDPRIGFAVFDTSLNKVTYHRIAYDIDKSAQKIIDAGLPHGFAYRLFNGV